MSSKITNVNQSVSIIEITDIGKAKIRLEIDSEREVAMLVARDEDRVVELYLEDQDASNLANQLLQWLLGRMKRGLFKPKKKRASAK